MSRTRQALIVEEDKDISGELMSLLSGLGFKVTITEDPTEVPDTLMNREFEVALMNMPLPDMTWKKTLKTVKNAARTTTIIMMSKSSDEDALRSALSSRAYAVLDRPLTQEQIHNLIAPQNDGLFVVLR